MFGSELLVSLALRERLGRLDETAAAVGIFLEIHVPSLGLSYPPRKRGQDIVMGLSRRCRRFRDLGQMTYVKSRNSREFRHHSANAEMAIRCRLYGAAKRVVPASSIENRLTSSTAAWRCRTGSWPCPRRTAARSPSIWSPAGSARTASRRQTEYDRCPFPSRSKGAPDWKNCRSW